MFEVSDLKEKFQNFNWEKLEKVRGKAHEGIIGEWINWWIGIDMERHMVLNPAPYVEGRSADIVFLRNIEEEGSGILPLYYPIGVAEVENEVKKWDEKVAALRAYEKEYSKLKTEKGEEAIKFLLLCATAKSVHREKFEELVKHITGLSKDSQLNWILYRLEISPWGEDTCPIVGEGDEVGWREQISGRELIIVKKGEVVT